MRSGRNKDRNPNSVKRFPAVLSVVGDDGQARSIPSLRTRGHARLVHNCAFVPMRVEFPKEEAKGTPFEKQEALKLVTHCHGSKEYEQYALRGSGQTLVTRHATFLESESDLARRLEGRIAELPRTLFRDLDSEALTFYSTINQPGSLKRELVDGCSKKAGM